MILRKFEAYGFKSFADKVDLEFGLGITAIVGPNGSGKSNIADAIRWALGEQSARDLRGTKMEDVIFSGSLQRRHLGIAEVSLLIDNTEGKLPLDYREVLITRRVFRSGEGEYFINKAPCRLKDIQNLLADTGLGKNALAVIGQNKVDEILNSKPEERRLLFEETAGITKYKNKKREAVRKIEETAQNLLRIADITTEIETQLGPMAESATQTAKYNELAEYLKKIQATILRDKLDQAVIMLDEARQKQAVLADAQMSLSVNLNLFEVQQEKLSHDIGTVSVTYEEKQRSVAICSLTLKDLDGQKAVQNERITLSRRAMAKSIIETNNLEEKLAEVTKQYAILRKCLQDKTGQNETLQAASLSIIQQYQESCASIDILSQRIVNAKDTAFEYMQGVISRRNDLRSLDKELLSCQHRHASMLVENNKVVDLNNVLQATQNELAENIKAVSRNVEQCLTAKTSLQEKFNLLEKKLLLCQASHNDLRDKYNQMLSRKQVLTSMQKQYEGFSREIKSILLSNSIWRKNICGIVAEVIDVPPQYVTAIEIALGGATQNIITEEEATAKQAIQFLKQQNLGRATFLPLTTIQPPIVRDYEKNAANNTGIVGLAAALIKYDEKYKSVIQYLLGRTLVAQDIDIALAIARQNMFRLRMVTLQGELINPGGSLSGGGKHRRESSYLSRSTEIALCNEQIEGLVVKIAQAESEIGQIKEELAIINGEKIKWDVKRQELQVKFAELTIVESKTKNDIKDKAEKVQLLIAEIVIQAEEIKNIQSKISEAKVLIQTAESESTTHNQDITVWQNELETLQQQKDSLNNSITDYKVDSTKVAQEIATLNDNSNKIKQDIAELQQQIQKYTEDTANIQTELVESQLLFDKLTADGDVCKTKYMLLQTQEKELLVQKMNLLADLQNLEKTIKDLRRRYNAHQTKLHDVEINITKFSYDETTSQEQLADLLGPFATAYQEYILDKPHDNLADDMQRVTMRIAEMGSINPGAIEEYEKMRIRYDFLMEQYNDLVEAKEYLHTVISDIDKVISKQFKLAFDTVNVFFKDIFGKLFGGGQAQLILVDPTNLLDTGIDITVQPPGKKQQNLALLSGGERALTVIALLFALLTYKPSPFCVLDEVDAALDEANVERFCDLLVEYAQNTQFIVVTHRKGTMERAKVMHGITMEVSGVSKFISVKMGDNE